MNNEEMDRRDILEKLMDFERCGLTAGTRAYLRHVAAIEIFKLRQELKRLKANYVQVRFDGDGHSLPCHPTALDYPIRNHHSTNAVFREMANEGSDV